MGEVSPKLLVWVVARLESDPSDSDRFEWLPLLGDWGFSGSDEREFSGGARVIQGASSRSLGHLDLSVGHRTRGGHFLSARPRLPFDLTPPFLLTDSESLRLVFNGAIRVRPSRNWDDSMTTDPTRAWRVKGADWAGVLWFHGHANDALLCRVEAFSVTNPRVEGDIYFGDSEGEILGAVT